MWAVSSRIGIRSAASPCPSNPPSPCGRAAVCITYHMVEMRELAILTGSAVVDRIDFWPQLLDAGYDRLHGQALIHEVD